jgi:hypothetical protein
MSATQEAAVRPTELEPDNIARLIIFDGVHDALEEGRDAIAVDELLERVGVDLKRLVPREVHNHPEGELGYLKDKIAVCVEAHILAAAGDDRYTLAPEPHVWIRYPDDKIEKYPAGLREARDRLTKVNASLRAAGFDVTRHLPHLERSAPEYRALVRSMREHGFIKERAVFLYDDGTYIDGVSRVRAAEEAGVEKKWMKFTSQDPETRKRRRDTQLERVLRALALNTTRLSDDQYMHVLNEVSAAADRDWAKIQADLELTRRWRTAAARKGRTQRSYTAVFEVTHIPFEEGGDSIVVVTADHKFHMTRLLSAVRLQAYKTDELKDYMAFEDAKYAGGGPAGKFAGATELIGAIQTMLADRRELKRKVDPKWEALLLWLQGYARRHRLSS